MENNLPEGENLKEIQESVAKYGRWRTLIDQIQAHLMPIVFVIIFFVLQYQIFLVNSKLEKTIQIQSSSNQTTVTVNPDPKNEQKNKTENIEEINPLGSSNVFQEKEWITDKFTKDDQGFYCHSQSEKSFEYWSMWSLKRIQPISPYKIRFLIKKKFNSVHPPTVFITYGEYRKNLSPLTFYRLSFFDSSNISIRLYDEKNESVQQEFLSEEPDFETEMIISFSPRSTSSIGRRLILNPTLNYNTLNSGTTLLFTPTREFSALLPTVEIEDKGIQKQIGIGVRADSCIKPIAVDL